MEQYRFGKLLKYLRKKHKYTQQDIAKIFGKTEAAVRMWELEKNQPDFNTLIQLAELYNVSLDFIAGKQKSIPYFYSLDNYVKFFTQFLLMMPTPSDVAKNIEVYGSKIDKLIQIDDFLYKNHERVYLCEISEEEYSPEITNGDVILISIGEIPPNSDVILLTPIFTEKNTVKPTVCLAHYQYLNGKTIYTKLGSHERVEINEHSRPIGKIIKIIRSR